MNEIMQAVAARRKRAQPATADSQPAPANGQPLPATELSQPAGEAPSPAHHGEAPPSQPRARKPRASLPKVIALGGKRRAGKSTAARMLRDAHGYEIISIAEPLKAMSLALGLKRYQTHGWGKDRPCEMLGGRTPRELQLALGDMLRAEFGADILLRVWGQRRQDLGRSTRVVCDDVRTAAEADWFREQGATVARLRAKRSAKVDAPGADHLTERDAWVADVTIDNDGTPDDLGAALMAGLMSAPSR